MFALLLSSTLAFSRSNLWILILFLIALLSIWIGEKGNILLISAIFLLHCLGDIFTMMMGQADGEKKSQEARIYQMSGHIVFLIIGLIAFSEKGEWQYLISQLPFLLSGYLAYRRDRDHIELSWMARLSLALLSVGLGSWYFTHTALSLGGGVQMIGFLLMPSILLIHSVRSRVIGMIIVLSLIVIGSGLLYWHSWQTGDIGGYELSYFLLPLGVVIFFLRQFFSTHHHS